MKKVLLTVAALLAISTGAIAADYTATAKNDTGFNIGGGGCGFACGGRGH